MINSFSGSSRANEHHRYDDKHHRDVFRLFLLEDAEYSKEHELPLVKAATIERCHPTALIPFSVAMGSRCRDFDCTVHFFEDDFRYERFWNNPNKYLNKLQKFHSVIMPEFSTCLDFPEPLKMWNAYRNHALAAWLQKNGVLVIPNARHEPECDFLLEALPTNSVIAICGRACVKDPTERRCFIRDVKTTVDTLKPTAIIYYGSDLYHVMDYPRSLGIPVWVYPGCGRGELDGGRRGQLS